MMVMIRIWAKIDIVIWNMMKMMMVVVATAIRDCGQSFVSVADSLVTRPDQITPLHCVLQLAEC